MLLMISRNGLLRRERFRVGTLSAKHRFVFGGVGIPAIQF